MEETAEAVAAEIAHDGAALAFGILLDGETDVAGVGAGLRHRDPAQQRFVGDVDQPFGATRNGADTVHAAGIAVPAVEDERDVDIDDVAFTERLVVGDAVADDVIDRGADRLAIAAIVERGWVGAMVHGELEGEIVEPRGGDARLDLVHEHVERLRRQAARLAHALEIRRPVQLDLAGLAASGERGVDKGHQYMSPGGFPPI